MKNKNESAFPEPFVHDPNLSLGVSKGLTKREYFAGLAMANILASKNPYYDGNAEGMMIPELVAKDALLFS